jgi:molybdopterin-containing oxidoreductase family iron-sulfur binding subunit
MSETRPGASRYGMVIDLDLCTGCGACMVACAVENNIPPARPDTTTQTGLTWLRVYRVDNGMDHPESREAWVPIPCQQCGHHPPCESVCPQNAVETDPETGIVDQVPVRCLGCRYCMTACPYHARAFNWWDPVWPEGMERTLNPDVAPRMRGVVEKCNFCHGRLQAARARAALNGEEAPVSYETACAGACPTKAITFGDLADPSSAVAQLVAEGKTFRLLERLGTDPKVHYLTERPWVRRAAGGATEGGGEDSHG